MVATNEPTVVPRRLRLSPRGRKIVMVVHIVTSVALFGEVWALVALVMLAMGWNLERISLGSLIIALGLLVDDGIIAVEMMIVKMITTMVALRS